MGELPTFINDSESSPGEGDKNSKEKQERRWVKPPLVPRSLELRKVERAPAMPPPPPSLLEKVVGRNVAEQVPSDTKEDDDDEEDEKKEPSAGEEAVAEAGAEESAAEDSDAEVPGQEAPQNIEAAQAAEQAPETPDEEPDDTVLHIRREPEHSASEADPLAVQEEDEPSRPAPVAAGGSGTTPPPPPPPPAAAGFPNQDPSYKAFAWNMAPQSPNVVTNNYNTAPQISVEQHKAEVKDAESGAEKRGLRRGLVAGFITGYVLKAYLAGRKRERYEKATEKQLEQRDEQISRLQREQQELADRMAARVEEYKRRQAEAAGGRHGRPEAAAGAAKAEAAAETNVPPEEQIFDREGNQIILQPGWRVERSAGGYSVVLDEHNRVVHDAIRYGEAYKRDQKREQLSDDLFATVGGGAPAGGPSDYVAGGLPPVAAQRQSQPRPADLPGQQPAADLNHRLPEPRNQLVSTVLSPWLWTAVAILIIVYFIAALA